MSERVIVRPIELTLRYLELLATRIAVAQAESRDNAKAPSSSKFALCICTSRMLTPET